MAPGCTRGARFGAGGENGGAQARIAFVDAFHQGVSRHTGISVGTVIVIVGVLLSGKGRMWVSGLSFEIVDSSVPVTVTAADPAPRHCVA